MSAAGAQPLDSPGSETTRTTLPRRWDRTLFLLLILGATLPYANTLLNAFVYDDVDQVLGNPYIRNFHYLRQIFTTSVWSFRDVEVTTNYYRPMMMTGYLLCYRLFGFAPYGFHLVNIVLNAAVVCLLFLLTAQMSRDRRLAFWAAALFALHPIHTEAVAWIGAAPDLEVTLFYLSTFWLFLEMARPGGSRSERIHLAMAGSFALALLSKEQALTLPLVAAVYEHFYRRDRAGTSLRQKLSRYGTLWLLAAAYVLLRVHFLGAFAPVSQFRHLTRSQMILSAFALVQQYIWKLIWPAHFCAFYLFQKSTSLLDPRVLGGIGGLVLCVALFMALRKRDLMASFGLVWALATLAPVLNAQWVGLNVFAERYLYLPSVGFCWVAAWGLKRLWEIASSRRPLYRSALATLLGILALLCTFRIASRNRDWRSDAVLYTTTLAVSPDAYPIQVNLGRAYAKAGDLEDAEHVWREVLKRAPDSVATLNNLGNLYLMQRRFWEAITSFQRAIHANPRSAPSHLGLGRAYTSVGLLEDAELQLGVGLALAPKNSLGYASLGVVHWRRGDLAQAESDLQRALSISPSDSQIHLVLASFYANTGRTTEAVREYQAALAIDPGNTLATDALLSLKSHPDTR
jgi:protein O-mannosyl-transferase